MNNRARPGDEAEFEFIVGAGQAGERIDALLQQSFSHCSRRAAREACESGEILCNERRVRHGYKVTVGDRISGTVKPHLVAARSEIATLESLGITVLADEKHYLALEKPACIHSVPLRCDDPPTVADALAASFPACRNAAADLRDSGLVQRLDFATSGVMLAAKDRATWAAFKSAITAGRMQKQYRALLEGAVSEEVRTITSIFRSIESGQRVRVLQQASGKKGDQQANTRIQLLAIRRNAAGVAFSLVLAESVRGVRHQIRAQCAAIGHPLAGDVLYGAQHSLEDILDSDQQREFYLHAERVSISDDPLLGSFVIRASEGMCW